MNAVGKSVIGMCRENNEDAIFVAQKGFPLENLYVVADGMGGCNAGDVASNSAIEAFIEYIKEQKGTYEETEILDLIVGGIAQCNHVVYNKSLESEKLTEMGTTFVVAAIQKERLYVAYVGDSRAYLFSSGNLRQITTDHSYVMELVKAGNITLEEAAVHPKRNIITRAIGSAQNVEADTVIEEFHPGDVMLLCSDGLSSMLTHQEIEEILKRNDNLENKAQSLVDLSNAKGGLDNISLILAQE